MDFLLSNDDGIYAPGLAALADRFADDGSVVVAAPDRERSASGHSITVQYPLRVRSIDYPKVCSAYWVDGTPADCVRLACESLLEEPCRIVVSGINDMANLGTDVIYSGTVSAAVEAAIMGLPALAVSLVAANMKCKKHWATAAEYAAIVAAAILQHGLPPGTVINLNVPNLPLQEIAGVKVTRLSMRRYTDGIHKREDPRGGTYFWRAGDAVDEEGQEGTDTQAVNEGYVSLTPIHIDLTHVPSLIQIADWNLPTLPGK